MRHTNHTIFEIKGGMPLHVLKYLEQELGSKFRIYDDEDEINIVDTRWYKETNSAVLPGDYVKIYRENAGFNQTELGKKLGSLSKQYISDLEHGRRKISKDLAKKLGSLFHVPISRFL